MSGYETQRLRNIDTNNNVLFDMGLGAEHLPKRQQVTCREAALMAAKRTLSERTEPVCVFLLCCVFLCE